MADIVKAASLAERMGTAGILGQVDQQCVIFIE